MIDIRESFRKLLNKCGMPVLVHSTDRKQRCRCWDPTSNEPDPRCRLCWGTGWASWVERTLARKDSLSFAPSRPKTTTIEEEGTVTYGACSFYLMHSVTIAPGDRIYEVKWVGDKPVGLDRVWFVSNVDDIVCEEGRVEFKVASCRLLTTNFDYYNKMVRGLGNIKLHARKKLNGNA